MPTVLPPRPRTANRAERRVLDALTAQLAPGDLVVVGQRVTDHLKDHEADFVVAIEGAGIVVIEVKGGEVWHDGHCWRQGHQRKPIEPVRQAREACYALREFVEKDPRWTQGRLRWDHVVVLPDTLIDPGFALPACPRWKVVDRNEIGELAHLLTRVLRDQELDRGLLGAAGIGQLTDALGGRGLPQRDVVARALAHESAADALSEQQAVILGAARLLRRVEIRGGAGSGKTFLALGGDGPDVRFVPCSAPDAVSVADDEIESLLEAGWRPEDLALLTTGSRHPEQVERQAGGSDAYWGSLWDAEQVFYGHVLGFKGLERRAVVVALN